MQKLNYDEYEKILKNKLIENKKIDKNILDKFYKKYLESKYKIAFGNELVDLSKGNYIIQASEPRGHYAEFWFISYDLQPYLLKSVEEGYKKNFSSHRMITNAMVIPDVVRALGLKSAEYYVTEYWDVDGYDKNKFLVTPNFLEEGEELFSIGDIVGYDVNNVSKIEERIREYYTIRHFPSDKVETLVRDYIKAATINKIISNTDDTNENMSIIVIGRNKDVRLAPLYDYDYCCSNQIKKCIKNVNKKTELEHFIKYYKKYPWFEEWLREIVIKLDIKSILDKLDEKRPNKASLSLDDKLYYERFFEGRKDVIKRFLKLSEKEVAEL